MRPHHKFVLGIAMVILLVSTSLIIVGSKPPPERTFKGTVKDLLPKAEEIPGWTVEYLPIADTPEMKAKVSEILNYDDAVFASYKNGTARLSVYIAYWAPEKMPYRLIASHTPDVCWVWGGWTIVEAQSGVRLEGGRDKQLLPTEMREMILRGNTEFVIFWHLLDGEPMSYGTRGLPPWYATFTDLFARHLNQRPEQFFIRISSDVPATQWNKTAVYRLLVEKLTMLRVPG
jgi:hypothetical protein